jgi:hypothetical protein
MFLLSIFRFEIWLQRRRIWTSVRTPVEEMARTAIRYDKYVDGRRHGTVFIMVMSFIC